MNEELLTKIMKDKVVDILKKKDYDVFERALIIQSAIDGHNGSAASLSRELGVERNEMLRAVQILKASEFVKNKVSSGELKGYLANRMIYQLQDPSRMDEVAEQIISKDLSAYDTDELIARVNNPAVVSNQLVSALWRSKSLLVKFKFEDIPKNRTDDVLGLISDLRLLLNKLESKFKLEVEV